MEIITQTPDLVICIKPVGVDSEKEMPQLLAQVLPGNSSPYTGWTWAWAG